MIWTDLANWNSMWDEMSDLQSRLKRALGENRAYPAIRLYQKGDDMMIRTELPGVKSEDLDISVQDDYLTLTLERKGEEKGENLKLLRKECPAGKYSRTVRLPFKIAADKIEAEFKKGVLFILLPRAEEDKPKKITIKAA